MSSDGGERPHDGAADGWLGIYPRTAFRAVRGDDAGSTTIRQARWYFAREVIAVANDPARVSGFARGMPAQADVARWAQDRQSQERLEFPPLVWIAAQEVIRGARLAPDGSQIAIADLEDPVGQEPGKGSAPGNRRLPFSAVERIPLNRSYFDASSVAFFARRSLKLRGEQIAGRFVARTVWPEDFALATNPPLQSLDATVSPQLALRARVRETSPARFDAATLWQRTARDPAQPRQVLALVLSGAQGDDDEAHGGHFAIATGRLDADGAIGDWMVDNFYALDTESEKGIIGAPVPLDNYLADLNAGQAWYRPNTMLVAVLRDVRAAAFVQGAMNRVYNQFYRHQLHYDHALMNCTGISVDTLRTLGLDVRARRPVWRALAPLALPWLVVTRRSLGRARDAYDYATEDATRLLPAIAFEEVGAALIALAQRSVKPAGPLASMLAEDMEALVFAHVPQLPSSRAPGHPPVASLREYRERLPRRRADMTIVPVPPRPFPSELRDDDPIAAPWRRSSMAIGLWIALAVALVAWLLQRA